MYRRLSVVACSCALLLAACGNNDKKPASDVKSESVAAVSEAVAEGEVVAIVNGVKIPASRLSVYFQGVPITDDNRQEIIDNMVTSELVAQAARKEGLDVSLQQQLIVAQQAVLGRAYATQLLENNQIDDAMIQKRYDEMVTQYKDRKEYQVSHILVEEEELGKELLAKVNEDQDSFAELAKEHSIDPGTKDKGGDLGWVVTDMLVPEFATVMESLQPGEISETLVKTPYGWHVIRVDDTRPINVPELNAELRERIRREESANIVMGRLQSLREGAQVTVF